MRAILDSAEFRAGAQSGAVALVVAVALGTAWLAWRHRRLPAGGLLLTAAGVVALERHADLPGELLAGLALLALAGLTGDVLHTPLALRAALAVPGAWLVGFESDASTRDWVSLAVAVAAVVGGTAASDLDRRWRHPSVGCGLLAIAFGGVYVTVPDTEAPLALLAPAVLLALVAWPAGLLRLGSGGGYAAIGLLAWVTAVGGVGRAGSIVGGLASLGLLLAEPAARVLAKVRGPLLPRPGAGAAVAAGSAQVVVVLATARVAGLRDGAGEAGIIAAVALVLATAACVVVARRARRGDQSAGVMLPSADTR